LLQAPWLGNLNSKDESYFPSDPRKRKEANKEFKKDVKPSKLKEAMVVSLTPIKVSIQ
jgi:hypothetical protein